MDLCLHLLLPLLPGWGRLLDTPLNGHWSSRVVHHLLDSAPNSQRELQARPRAARAHSPEPNHLARSLQPSRISPSLCLLPGWVPASRDALRALTTRPSARRRPGHG